MTMTERHRPTGSREETRTAPCESKKAQQKRFKGAEEGVKKYI